MTLMRTVRTLYVRDKNCRVILLHEAVTPAGTLCEGIKERHVARDKFGHVEIVSAVGAYIGILTWQSASAWLETSDVRDLVAYKNPTGAWVWR